MLITCMRTMIKPCSSTYSIRFKYS